MDNVERLSQRRLWRSGQVVLALVGAIALLIAADWALGTLTDPNVRDLTLFLLPALAVLLAALYGMHLIQRRLDGPLALPA